MDIAKLKQLVPLNALSDENLQELASKANSQSLKAGSFLFKIGDKDERHIFVLNGEVELMGRNIAAPIIKAGTEIALHAIPGGIPRSLSARAKTDVEVVSIDSDLLDMMLTWDQTATGYEVEELDFDDDDIDQADDWMTRILQTKAFHRVPPANIQAMFMRMEAVTYAAGDTVIEQGEEGHYFFIVREGRCAVSRSSSGSGNGVRLAELGIGDSFGEEALISNNKRNATVTMTTDGMLMRLSKEDFISLLNEPMLQWVTFDEAMELVAKAGARWVDVRLPGEYQQTHILESINIPLIFLRMKLSTFNESGRYIIYCDTGRRSSAAAYLLGERGYDAVVLKDAMTTVPATVWEGQGPPPAPG